MQAPVKNFCLYHGTSLGEKDENLLKIIKNPQQNYVSQCKQPWSGIWCSRDPQVAAGYAYRWDQEKGKGFAGTILEVNVLSNKLYVEKERNRPLQQGDIPKEHWHISGKGVYAGQHAQDSKDEEILVKLGESVKIKIHPHYRVVLDQQTGKPVAEKIVVGS